MEESIVLLASLVASAIEIIMVVVVACGSLQAVYGLVRLVAARQPLAPAVREAWLHYAAWILLALEFALAADLIRTVIAPSWEEIGQLAAIAAIRTALSWFLGRDLAEFEKEIPPDSTAA